MGKADLHGRGFTLIASLLVLALLSAVAVGLLFMVGGAGQVGGNDLENNLAYYGAESGMEKLTADLAALYQQKPAAQAADIQGLANNTPDSTMVSNMTYSEQITWPQSDANGNPKSQVEVIENGWNAGLSAEVIPLTLQVRASRPSGAEVSMVRKVQVVLIPVFQYGVFSDSDLSYFAGPQFDFEGRVHTNGNLFLAANSGPLILGDKVTAVGEIVRDRLANNFNNGSSYQGNVFAPTSSGGCDPPGLNTNPGCKSFVIADASWSGGIPKGAGAANQQWTTDVAPWNTMIANHVHTLQLPFVQGNPAAQVQIVRKAPAGEAVSSALGSSREYNKATLRILLADTQADLHPDRGLINDGNDVQLDAVAQVQSVSGTPNGSISYFAMADPVATGDPNLKAPTCNNGVQGPNCAVNNTWPLVKGWLRVEYLDSTSGNWVGITNEWLNLGFAKDPYKPRTAPGVDVGVHPNAILLFQQLADRDGNGSISNGATPNGTESTSVTGPGSKNNFYPINFYDPREGEPRDNAQGNISPTCRVNGIMNAVELDVGNLNQWLINSASGKKVNYLSQNGYLLYFSDRRGMVQDPNAANLTYGEYGFEDVVNSASATGTPDGTLEAQGSNGLSPEDVDENGKLDAWGGANVGDGFGVNTNTNPVNPYKTVDCMSGGRQSWVSGARHVLRLIDGSLGNVPIRPDNGQGGFTVASENPVYVQGDYNTNVGDPFWTNAQAADIAHAAAAIIADSVTLLSNNWSDLNDMKNTLNLTNRQATDTYYRMAIAGGKNMNFPQPNGTGNDFGTDGGVHNFLRYIESWRNGAVKLGYRGSLVSLYYSQYATGAFKCCTLVYEPPNRQYFFDTEFLNPQNLPPGTPMLQDVENLSYWQDFSPRQPGQ